MSNDKIPFAAYVGAALFVAAMYLAFCLLALYF
jgi:hypothetical protein